MDVFEAKNLVALKEAAEAMNLIALKGAAHPDFASQVRYVIRWYSKTFSTPLHVVEEEIPMEDVWLAFFEEKYEDMEPEELERAIEEALKTPDERNAEDDAAAADQIAEKKFLAMTESAAKAPNPPPPIVPVAPEPTPSPQLEPDIQFEFVDDDEMARLLETDTKPATK